MGRTCVPEKVCPSKVWQPATGCRKLASRVFAAGRIVGAGVVVAVVAVAAASAAAAVVAAVALAGAGWVAGCVAGALVSVSACMS